MTGLKMIIGVIARKIYIDRKKQRLIPDVLCSIIIYIYRYNDVPYYIMYDYSLIVYEQRRGVSFFIIYQYRIYTLDTYLHLHEQVKGLIENYIHL